MKTIKSAQRKLDNLWSTVGREDAYCEVCDTLPVEERVNYTQLHSHHIVTRTNKTLRWDLRNRIWLCPTHHTLGNKCAEHNQFGWFWDKSGNTGWMGKHRLEDKKYLMKQRNVITKRKLPDYISLIERLK